MSRDRQQERQGFVLLTVLVMVALIGLLTVRLAQHSLFLALEALEAQASSQHRWALVSMHRALLQDPETVFRHQENRSHETRSSDNEAIPARLSGRIPLGGINYEFLLADESAKINLNSVLQTGNAIEVKKILTEFRTGGNLPISLRPSSVRTPEGRRKMVGSWGQVFSLARTPDDLNSARVLMSHTKEVTCWGNGRLNWRRASDRVVGEVCRPTLGAEGVRLLNQLRKQRPSPTFAELLNRMQLNLEERQTLSALLTDQSQSYSLWIAPSQNHRHGGVHLFVKELRADGSSALSTFRW